eukprot:s4267_g5.t1
MLQDAWMRENFCRPRLPNGNGPLFFYGYAQQAQCSVCSILGAKPAFDQFSQVCPSPSAQIESPGDWVALAALEHGLRSVACLLWTRRPRPNSPPKCTARLTGSPESSHQLTRTEKQRTLLSEFSRKEQHFNEEYQKNKPLCFSAKSYQRTHPKKLSLGHKDADATLASPMILGVADGVSQLEEFGMDASQLPRELLRICEDLGMNQLIPDRQVNPQEAYQGPVSLLKEAYEETESMGSTTILLAVLDNSTKIHGKLHPMVAVLTIGDCELLMLRRLDGRQSPLQAVFHTEMQRIDGHSQTPLQLARVDDRVDPDFDEELALEVIERGSAVHCVSAYEGDIIILGSDGIFDNLFLEEIVDIVNESLPAPKAGSFVATQPSLLSLLAKRLVDEAHSKSEVGRHGLPDTPIGLGGKMDDTSVVVGEVVEWTRAHSEVWAQVRKQHQWRGLVSCGGMDNMACRSCRFTGDDSGSEYELDISQEKGERGLCSTVVSDGDSDDEGTRCVLQ